MIVTQKKPTEEILAMIGDAKNVAIVGCGSCATTCQTGGMQQAEELRAILEDMGKTVVGIAVIDYCCMSLTVRPVLKPILAAQPECIICMGCGTGVQCVGKSVGMIPTYPSNNTMYVGEAVRCGMRPAGCVATVCWDRPVPFAPLPTARKVCRPALAADRKTANVKSIRRTTAYGSTFTSGWQLSVSWINWIRSGRTRVTPIRLIPDLPI